MTATEELRRILDERGVEHEDSELIDHGDRTTTYYTEWGGNDDGDGANVYAEYMDGTVLRVFDATPEQAIAATLGNTRADYHGYEQAAIEAWESIKKWNTSAHGTLTAEQVMGAFENHANMAFPRFVPDWQAIADELNTRAERTCRNVAKDDSRDEFVCSECGHVDGAYEYGPEVGEHCKGCGRKVVSV